MTTYLAPPFPTDVFDPGGGLPVIRRRWFDADQNEYAGTPVADGLVPTILAVAAAHGVTLLDVTNAQAPQQVGNGYYSHGEVSGILTLVPAYGLQEATVSGDTILTPSGPPGTIIVARVAQDAQGGHTVVIDPSTVIDGDWTMPSSGGAADVIVFTHWPDSGWIATPKAATALELDLVNPDAGALTASEIGSTSFAVSIAGASDNLELASLPFAFSLNGGAYTDWTDNPVHTFTNLTGLTNYTARHRVRDAAGNISYGPATAVTTLEQTIANPTDLGSCLAYFDASDAAKLTVAGGNVTGWAASGGTHSWTYTQDGAGTLPTVAQVNGKNAVALSADGARLMARVGGTVAPHFDIGGAKTAPFTVWQILKVTATGGGGVVAQWTPGIQAQMRTTVGTIFGLGGSIVSAAVYQLGEVFLLALTSNATPNSKLFRGPQMVGQVNNAAGATLFGEATNSVNYTYIGANGQTLRATLCEFGFHTKELSGAELTQLQAYAAAKWGAA